jgi:hypothetical protein
MSVNRIIAVAGNLILIDTTVDINPIVPLPLTIVAGQTVTIRDNTGAASASNSIFISTIQGVSLISGIANVSNLIQIQQPFGYVTLTSAPPNKWNLIDTFGFQPEKTVYNIEEIAVSTIVFKDIYTQGSISQLNVSNGTLLLDGAILSGEITQQNLNISNITASTITLAQNSIFTSSETTTRLNIAGTVATNFLTLNDQSANSSNIISLSNNTLYRNSYPVAPIGGYIEFAYISAPNKYSTTTYPLYVGTLTNLAQGWWDTNSYIFSAVNACVNGFIVFPGFSLRVNGLPDNVGTIICSVSNITSFPIYSNVQPGQSIPSDTPYFNASYVLRSIS